MFLARIGHIAHALWMNWVSFKNRSFDGGVLIRLSFREQIAIIFRLRLPRQRRGVVEGDFVTERYNDRQAVATELKETWPLMFPPQHTAYVDWLFQRRDQS
jgi:hypothetical protein